MQPEYIERDGAIEHPWSHYWEMSSKVVLVLYIPNREMTLMQHYILVTKLCRS